MRIFLVLPLLALLAAPTLPAWSAPARTAAVKTAAQTAKETESLQALQRRFEALDADAKRGLLREHWLRLIADCAALAAASKGETQVQAAFLAARGREELSNRSHSGADRRQAIAAYADLAGTYPRSALAPRSLYRQARLLGVILGRVKEADAVLEALLRRYPQSRAAGEAKALRAALAAGAKTPAAAKADPQAKKTAPPIPKKPAEPSVPPQAPAASASKKTPAPSASKKAPAPSGQKTVPAAPGPKKAPAASASKKTPAPSGQKTVPAAPGPKKAATASGPKKAPASSPPKPAKAADPASVMERLGLGVHTIMLDPGHGGKDPGCLANKLVEKDFTLDMAKRIGALLEKKGFAVLYTRSGDTFISLADRPDLANKERADLFISLHLNANPDASVRGLETYYLSEARTGDAAKVAARENGVSLQNISDLQVILTDLMLSAKLKESRSLARCVQQAVLGGLREAGLSIGNGGVRSAPFYVLMGTRMPAVLVEFGYATNAREAANLLSEKFLQRQAEGVVNGILAYKEQLAKSMR